MLDSPLIKVFPELREYASASFPAGRPLGEAACHLMRRIHRDFRFIPGSTSLQTTLEMVFQTLCGVCQDFSHLMLPGPRHIILAWGRDFSDVSSLRGMLYGGGTQKLKVEVDVFREDGSPAHVEPWVPASS